MEGGAAVIVAERIEHLFAETGVEVETALRDEIAAVADKPPPGLLVGN